MNSKAIKNYFNDRKILICREISKLYEEYLRSTVEELKLFQDMPKGELTLVLSEKKKEETAGLRRRHHAFHTGARRWNRGP